MVSPAPYGHPISTAGDLKNLSGRDPENMAMGDGDDVTTDDKFTKYHRDQPNDFLENGATSIELLRRETCKSMESCSELFSHGGCVSKTMGKLNSVSKSTPVPCPFLESPSPQRMQDQKGDTQFLHRQTEFQSPPAALFNRLPYVQLEVSEFSVHPTISSTTQSTTLPALSTVYHWSLNNPSPRYETFHYCKTSCSMWDSCQPTRCIVDQNEIQICPSVYPGERPIIRAPLDRRSPLKSIQSQRIT